MGLGARAAVWVQLGEMRAVSCVGRLRGGSGWGIGGGGVSGVDLCAARVQRVRGVGRGLTGARFHFMVIRGCMVCFCAVFEERLLSIKTQPATSSPPNLHQGVQVD